MIMKKNIFLNQNIDVLPYTNAEAKIEGYSLYAKEHDASNKYRLVFSFNPICSNVLFNRVTEVVLNESSDECMSFPYSGGIGDGISIPLSMGEYLKYTGRSANDHLNRFDMISDTAYSHPKIADVTYHCGYDIFNNHILRSNTFFVINKMGSQYSSNYRKYFNTLQDYIRDADGYITKNLDLKDTGGTRNIERHIYVSDSISNFLDTVDENLTEQNGWLGFYNKGGLNIANYNDLVINKVINSKSIGSFIDMYPDRTLFSPIPKYNNKRKRNEHNWEFCLTYPYKNDFNNKLVVYNGYNGLECLFKLNSNIYIGIMPDSELLTLRSIVEHNLKPNDRVKIAFFWNDSNGVLHSGETPDECVVVETGDTDYESKHYFKIRESDLDSIFASINNSVNNNFDLIYNFHKDFFEENNVKFRFCKVVSKRKCKYYLRKFKKMQNTNIQPYRYTVNKMAFSKNIYNDRVGEIIYDDIIDLDGLRDNLDRKLSEIYVTIFKTNYGHKEWYQDKNYTGETVEYSHCFGPITSGLDLPNGIESKEYNVHYLHNVPYGSYSNCITTAAQPLDNDISLHNNDVFYGDLVELNEVSLTETVLEDVFFRFNTMQRELISDDFKTFKYSEISFDDFDVRNGDVNFLEEKDIRINNEGEIDENYYINLNPEGYYYKAHYRIPIKEYKTEVAWGMDTKMTITKGRFVNYKDIGNGVFMPEYKITCDKIYYMNVYDKIYVVDKTNYKNKSYGFITYSNGTEYNFVLDYSLQIDLNNYELFKVNPLKPDNAYNFDDGTGMYNWRDFKSFSEIDRDSELYNRPFTNGTHYLYENINLYLRRQDPFGLYEMSFNGDTPLSDLNLTIYGNEKDVKPDIYYKRTEPELC